MAHAYRVGELIMTNRFPVDLHTHTIASDHAYSTLEECIARAGKNGLVMFACTDHGTAIKDSPYRGHFTNMGVIPRICDGGVAVLRGIEANILGDGSIDADASTVSKLDIVLAGFHPNLPPCDDRIMNTGLLKKVIKSGLVDIISHPGIAQYPSDYEAVVRCAKEYGVAIEINSSSSVNTRMGSHENCVKIASLCRDIGATVSLGSDAHISYFMGNFEESERVIEESGLSDDQIINTSPLKVLDFLEGRGHKRIDELREFFSKARQN